MGNFPFPIFRKVGLFKMKAILHGINKISERTGETVSLLILPLIGIIVFGVIMRYIFNNPLDWDFESSLFAYGLHFMLGGSYCLMRGAHVSVEAIPGRLSKRGQILIQAVSSLVIIFCCIIIVLIGSPWAWQSTKILEHSIHQTTFNPPIWWYKWVVPLSALLILLQAIADFVVAIQELINDKKTEER